MLTVKNQCRIHYWQHMKISKVYEFEQHMLGVTFDGFLRWFRAEFREVISSLSGFVMKVYYLSHLERWDEKITIESDETLRSYLLLVSNDATLESYVMVSIENDSPTKAPCDDDASTQSSVSALSNSSGGSIQTWFRDLVLTRDGYMCVFCGNSAELEAVHIFDLETIPAEDPQFLERFGIITLYDTRNGLTLCGECHHAFDSLLCCVKVIIEEGVVTHHHITISNALKSSSDKWSQLDGTEVRVPTEPRLLAVWPPVKLFKFQETTYDEFTQKRQQKAHELPVVCPYCQFRVRTK